MQKQPVAPRKHHLPIENKPSSATVLDYGLTQDSALKGDA